LILAIRELVHMLISCYLSSHSVICQLYRDYRIITMGGKPRQ
jgi:hypothetical protein